MIRLHVVVEGQTEETFVRDVLLEHLADLGIFTDAHCVTTGRRRGRTHRGGHVSYNHLRKDLVRWMWRDGGGEVRFTTMVDLYRLPEDFPSIGESRRITDPIKRAVYLEAAFEQDVNDRRFVPYIQVHEFEALLFSDPNAFLAAFPSRENEIAKLMAVKRAATSPEHIDGGDSTHPSRRICGHLREDQKVVHGALIANRIGLGKNGTGVLAFQVLATDASKPGDRLESTSVSGRGLPSSSQPIMR